MMGFVTARRMILQGPVWVEAGTDRRIRSRIPYSTEASFKSFLRVSGITGIKVAERN